MCIWLLCVTLLYNFIPKCEGTVCQKRDYIIKTKLFMILFYFSKLLQNILLLFQNIYISIFTIYQHPILFDSMYVLNEGGVPRNGKNYNGSNCLNLPMWLYNTLSSCSLATLTCDFRIVYCFVHERFSYSEMYIPIAKIDLYRIFLFN